METKTFDPSDAVPCKFDKKSPCDQVACFQRGVSALHDSSEALRSAYDRIPTIAFTNLQKIVKKDALRAIEQFGVRDPFIREVFECAFKKNEEVGNVKKERG